MSQADPAHAENLIVDAAALARVCERCRECEAVAVDTEFVWTKTYYPRLGLIQLAVSPEEAWLIDTVELTDLGAMAAMLTDANTVKVFHDPEMDLPILVRATGCRPGNVFDTRLAAGFAGFPGILSLARLIEEFFGIELPKTQTRTDWCHRPLTPHQLAYALDDVRYMPKLRRLLLARVAELGNSAWMEEEMARYDLPEQVAPSDPDEMFRTVKGMGKLPPPQLAILQKLVAWRELAARRMDLPRKRVLSDEACMELAKRQPKDGKAVADLKCVARRTARECADEVATAIAQGAAAPKADWPRFRSSPLPQKVLKVHADAILESIRGTATEHGVDPGIVTSRKDVNSLVLDQAAGNIDGHALRTGWRAELLGQTLDPLLAAVATRQ